MSQKKYFFLLIVVNSCILLSSQTFSIIKEDTCLRNYSTQKNLNHILFPKNKIKKSKDSCIIYDEKIQKSKLNYLNGEDLKSEKKAKSVLKDLKNKNKFCFIKLRIEALNRLFWLSKKQKLYNNAINYLTNIEDEFKKIPKESSYFTTTEMTIMLNKSVIQSLLENHTNARSILKKIASKIISRKSKKVTILNMIGESFIKSSTNYKSNELDSANLYFKKAYDIAKTLSPMDNDIEAHYDLRKSEVFIAKKKYKKALRLIRKWKTKTKEGKFEKCIYFSKSVCFFNLNKNDSTIYYAKKFIKNHKKNRTSKAELADIYNILGNQYYKNKTKDSTFKYKELALVETKKINKKNNEISKFHYMNELHKSKLLQKKTSLKNKKNLRRTYLYLAGLLVLFIGTLKYFLKKDKKAIIESDLISGQQKKFLAIQKKTHIIDSKLEQKILKGLNNLEKENYYLKTSFNLNNLAVKLKTNTSYVSQTINKTKGKTFKQYYTSLRIEYLIKQFEEDKNYRKYTIEYVGQLIGYTNASAFSRAFKKHKGITPSEFIKKLEKREN